MVYIDTTSSSSFKDRDNQHPAFLNFLFFVLSENVQPVVKLSVGQAAFFPLDCVIEIVAPQGGGDCRWLRNHNLALGNAVLSRGQPG